MTENLKSAPGVGWIDTLEIGALGPADAGAALDLYARGMRDNPVNLTNDPGQDWYPAWQPIP